MHYLSPLRCYKKLRSLTKGYPKKKKKKGSYSALYWCFLQLIHVTRVRNLIRLRHEELKIDSRLLPKIASTEHKWERKIGVSCKYAPPPKKKKSPFKYSNIFGQNPSYKRNHDRNQQPSTKKSDQMMQWHFKCLELIQNHQLGNGFNFSNSLFQFLICIFNAVKKHNTMIKFPCDIIHSV